MANSLNQLQQRIEALMEASAWFSGVTILTEDKGSLSQQIEAAVAGIEFFATVITPDANNVMRDIPDGYHDRLILEMRCAVSLSETHLLNSTGKRAKEGMQELIKAVHGQPTELGTLWGDRHRIHLDSYGLIEHREEDLAHLTTYQAIFRARVDVSGITAQDSRSAPYNPGPVAVPPPA